MSFGASWVGRAFSGDVKGTAELMKAALLHHGFSFLNIISPCVTWRGDDQHKELRAKLAALPPDHDRTSFDAALKFTNERDVLTAGVLYEVKKPTLVDEMIGIGGRAAQRGPAPRREELLRGFM
jgi:2-oxoglutarate/2-oxoacid ferredoxin oxidoreductase subunit beta